MEEEISFEELRKLMERSKGGQATLKLNPAEPVEIRVKEMKTLQSVQACKDVSFTLVRPVVNLIIDRVNGVEPVTGTIEYKIRAKRLINIITMRNGPNEIIGKTFSIGFTMRKTGAKVWEFNPVGSV